jgi:hypothetical protein
MVTTVMAKLDLLFLIPVFIIGIICSGTDIKFGKIKNFWVGIGLIWVTLLYSYLALKATVLSPNTNNVHYLLGMVTNGLLAIIIGFCMWSSKLWAAGDAKLFSLFTFLIPLNFYKNSYIPYFPALDLLINTFCLIIIFLAFEASFFWLKELFLNKKISLPQKRLDFVTIAKTYLLYLTMLIGINFIMTPLTGFFSRYLPNQNLILLTLLIFVFRGFLFGPLFKNKWIIWAMILLTGGYIIFLTLNGKTATLFNIVGTAIIYMTAIRILIYFIDRHIERESLVKIEAEKEIKLYKSFAFAPFLLAGCILTVLINGSLISFLIKVF